MAERATAGRLAARREARPTASGLRTEDFDYPLDEGLIAQHPLPRRDASRLLLVRREGSVLEDRSFSQLASLFSVNDVLVINDTRVFPARLLGRKTTGAAAEILLIEAVAGSGYLWRALVRPGGKLKPGRVVEVADDLKVAIEGSEPGGARLVRLITELAPDEAFERYGRIPLPPYIRREDEEGDRVRYQTVYARSRGSVAAPTAGLHFTPELLAAIGERGVKIARITLHVGPGTFRPVQEDDPAAHVLHPEWYRVDAEAADMINSGRAKNGRIWAVGTTAVRTLETVATAAGRVAPGVGVTDLYILPGYRFRIVDRLITNFHLPRSTLLMLVAAFAGHGLTMAAYRHAQAQRYRFYSYGDAMAVV